MALPISIAGTGNMAWNLGHALKAAGLPISRVLGRSAEAAEQLATALDCRWSPIESDALPPDGSLVLLCVKDEAISDVAGQLEPGRHTLVHTSGSTPLSILQPHASRCGVLYPLQTLTRDSLKSFRDIPLCVEAADVETEMQLREIATAISRHVVTANSAQRLYLHLAAVLANNFTNHLYTQAQILLEANNLPFDLLKPLIRETAEKVMTQNPADVQTGPARRNDQAVMNKHLELLQDNPELQELYRRFSALIRNNS